ncbi:ATP-grasp domain-containing protein [Paenibacillus polymyxa]|uniref:ATP-binding protein n=1 Tax=Paenibacillus polymyxa TaxID=1406 RepID=UPI00307F1812
MGKKILFIGGLFLERFSPFLKKKGLSIYLISTNKNDSTQAADYFEYNPLIKPNEIVEFIKFHNINGVISKIDADNEFTYVRDAMVKEALEPLGIPFFGLDLRAATISMDKAIQRSLFEAFNIPIPRGAICSSFDEVTELSDLSFPLVLKKPIGSVSNGVFFVESKEKLKETYDAMKSEIVVVEEFVEGYEIGLEAIVWKGSTQIYPGALLGETSIKSSPHSKVRICPFLSSENQEEANDLLHKLIDAIKCEGIIQVDTVFNPKTKKFLVLEVNCRFNGMSDLTSSASGLNIFNEAISCVLNEWKPKEIKKHDYAVEIPVKLNKEEFGRFVYSNPLVKETRLVNGMGLIHLATSDPNLILDFISSLPENCKEFEKDELISCSEFWAK